MLIYLASPYSAPTEQERKHRFELVCKKAAQLMLDGNQVFCPIAHSHPIETLGMDHMEGHDFWLHQDFAILRHCEAMFVYKLPGWTLSRGVAAEIEYAEKLGIPIGYLEFEEQAKLLAA
jgi:hypothetical protein